MFFTPSRSSYSLFVNAWAAYQLVSPLDAYLPAPRVNPHDHQMPLPQPSSTPQTAPFPSILAQHHPRPSRIPSPQVRYPSVPTGHRAATHRYHARLRRRCVAKARKVALQQSCPRLLPIAKRAWSTSRPVARWTVVGLRRANAGSRCWAEYVAPLGSDGCPRCASWLPKGRRIFFLACFAC